ncbi:DUF362 domain-containing protein [Sporomusa sp. KB1]|jgi:uncharacterized protein (DUF362 family)|uniref:DUF362 domain-containing protein n=1 Tax=Sporomusa sp. KB1 TaxID=943346 RepID=UPI0011A26FB8|nr:DUF362 domain-containing protein [Sporomusa sp. KB1]TWH47148.1 uncharacterized protein (DUF362 family) [Sporomusa sp. KB1]
MDRRQFISGIGYGLVSLGLAGCGLNLSERSGNSQNTKNTPSSQSASSPVSGYDRGKLIISEGTDPNSLIEKGFAALGGIGALVRSGATVVLKPNFSVARKPEEAATTNPQLVAAVVKQCLAAGAKEVKVLDYPFQSPAVCLVNSGIKEAVEAVGGKAYAINAQSFYTQVDTGGKILKSVLFSKDVLSADVFINFPILKHHSITKLTLGLKNMMGLVWDRGYFHKTDLTQGIAELTAFHKPHLTIVDATRGIIDNGPTGPGTIREWNQVIFGVDPVAVDTYAATLFGIKPTEIEYVTAAAQLGVGEMDLQKLTVVKV